jgi:hypothetical protein
MMNQEDLFKKLGAILNELNDQYEYLAQNPQKFNELELELFLANANFLAEHVQIIRKINSNRVIKELPEHTVAQENNVAVEKELPSFEFVLHERPKAEVAELPHIEEELEYQPQSELQLPNDTNDRPEQGTTDHHDYEMEAEQKAAAYEEDTIIQEEDTITQEEEPALADEVGPEPFLVKKEEDKVPEPATQLVADEVEKKLVRPTLNDLLASSLKKDGPAAAQSSEPAVKDLKQAINLNDKLLYIKDLFNGYNLAYSEAIELINKMPDFKTADAFLRNNYAIKNNWAVKQATVDKFYELLHRRF